MKDLFLWILVAFITLCGCVISYRYGLTTGQAACPIKYAVCENGTCVLSDAPPGK